MSAETRAFLFGLGAGAAFWPIFYAAGQLSEQREGQDREPVGCGSEFMGLRCMWRDGHDGPHGAVRPGGAPLEWPP